MKLLFLCVANSARSQMAEGLAKHILGNTVEIISAGSQPRTVHPMAITVMQESGIDISQQVSKSIDTIDLVTVDMIITLCAEEVCPFVQGNQTRLHWPLPDPANPSLTEKERHDRFKHVRDTLYKNILQLKPQLISR